MTTEKQERKDQKDPLITNLLSSFNNNGGPVNFTISCSECGIMKRKRHSSSLSSSFSESPNNHSSPANLFSPPKKIQLNSTNFISASFSNPNYPSSLQTMASSSVSPSPTLPLLSPSSASPPSPSLPLLSPSCVSPTPPRNLDSFSAPKKSWQEIVSSAFPAPSGNPDCVLSLSCGQCGGGSQKQDSPLQSIFSPLSASSVPPSLGWRPSPSPSPPLLSPSFVLPSPPLLSPSPVSPSPRKPNSLYRHGLISSALSTPLTSPTMEATAANSSSRVLCGQCSGGSKRQDSPLLLSPSSPLASETAQSNGGGATPPSAAAKRWMRVRDDLKEMQRQWTMNNISQQLKEQNNEAPVIAVTEKPHNDINNQEAFQTVSSAQNVEAVQKAVQDENVSIDRDGDTIRVCYICGCGRQKQIFFAITN
ncbi:proline-rich protein 36-like isoform X2 [Papaver somniferum]|uniref:proline-rich protein 36-like isoform X2 n=1 Tax=Papaver somniferum TaxID=3469 RepID=UPI000E6F6EEE|nr:proline-rich protein 36-like isoform X2 [Papaver somniferum]